MVAVLWNRTPATGCDQVAYRIMFKIAKHSCATESSIAAIRLTLQNYSHVHTHQPVKDTAFFNERCCHPANKNTVRRAIGFCLPPRNLEVTPTKNSYHCLLATRRFDEH